MSSSTPTPQQPQQIIQHPQLPPVVSRDAMRLPLLADAAMAVAVNGASAVGTSTINNGVNSSAAGAAPTLTTPTLTPTTLRNIEQMFMDTEDPGGADELRPPDPHENSARFEPPRLDVVHEEQAPPAGQVEIVLPQTPIHPFIKLEPWVADGSVLPGPHSNSDSNLTKLAVTATATSAPLPPPVAPVPSTHLTVTQLAAAIPGPSVELPTVPVKLLPTEPVPCTSLSSTKGIPASNGFVLTESQPSSGTLIAVELPSAPPNDSSEEAKPIRKRKGSSTSSSSSPAVAARGSKRSSSSASNNLTPDEEHKKTLRRQRNKEAAARCRKRRLDQTLTLQAEVDKWEARKSETEEEIRELERQKVDLEALLDAHRSDCRAGGKVKRTSNPPAVTVESSKLACVKKEEESDGDNEEAATGES